MHWLSIQAPQNLLQLQDRNYFHDSCDACGSFSCISYRTRGQESTPPRLLRDLLTFINFAFARFTMLLLSITQRYHPIEFSTRSYILGLFSMCGWHEAVGTCYPFVD